MTPEDSTRPLRIGMFADMYLPHVSGVTNQIQLYRHWLEQRGHEVTVFTWGTDHDHDPDRDRAEGIVRSPGIPWGTTGWQVPIRVSREAARHMRQLDIAHAHHPLAARTALTHTDAPVVFTNHTRYDLFADRYASLVPRRVRQAVVRAGLTSVGGSVAAVLAPTPRIAEWARSCGMPAQRVHVFPNTIDAQAFACPDRTPDRDLLGVPADALVIAHVGRLAAEKNLPLLAAALHAVLDAHPDAWVVIVGDGPERAQLESALSRFSARVVFLGMRGHEELPPVLHAADVFVTASTTETFGLVVLEAAAAGVPTVGVRSPGVGELVAHETTGLLTAENPDDLAAAIGSLAADRARTQRMGQAASEAAAAFDVRHSVDRLLSLYRDLLASR